MRDGQLHNGWLRGRPHPELTSGADQIGLMGCGVLGRALGVRLLRRGYGLAVHDTNPERAAPLLAAGAMWVERASALASGATLIISALPNPEDSESVALAGELWSGAARGLFHLEAATVGVSSVRRLSSAAARKGINYLDAPISRGTASERGLRLVMYVGADGDHFDRTRPILESMVDRVLYCGGVGKGQVTKLINNLVTEAMIVILGDALAMGVRSGASVDLLRSALHEGTAQTRLLDEMLPASVFRGDWRPGLRLDLAEKDLGLALELAQEHGMELTAIHEIRGVYRRAMSRGWSGLSAHAVVRLIEEAAGVELRSPIFQALDTHQDPPQVDSEKEE